MNDISSTTPPNTLRQRRPLHTGRPDRCDRLALVLQGGGALGAYQAGVYQAMHEANIMPDWVAGVSIGAINAAIIAGNPPHRRIAQLHAFWDLITERKIWAYTPDGDLPQSAQRDELNDDHGRGSARLLHPALHQPMVELHRSARRDELLR
jgi:NTE family protein